MARGDGHAGKEVGEQEEGEDKKGGEEEGELLLFAETPLGAYLTSLETQPVKLPSSTEGGGGVGGSDGGERGVADGGEEGGLRYSEQHNDGEARAGNSFLICSGALTSQGLGLVSALICACSESISNIWGCFDSVLASTRSQFRRMRSGRSGAVADGVPGRQKKRRDGPSSKRGLGSSGDACTEQESFLPTDLDINQLRSRVFLRYLGPFSVFLLSGAGACCSGMLIRSHRFCLPLLLSSFLFLCSVASLVVCILLMRTVRSWELWLDVLDKFCSQHCLWRSFSSRSAAGIKQAHQIYLVGRGYQVRAGKFNVASSETAKTSISSSEFKTNASEQTNAFEPFVNVVFREEFKEIVANVFNAIHSKRNFELRRLLDLPHTSSQDSTRVAALRYAHLLLKRAWQEYWRREILQIERHLSFPSFLFWEWNPHTAREKLLLIEHVSSVLAENLDRLCILVPVRRKSKSKILRKEENKCSRFPQLDKTMPADLSKTFAKIQAKCYSLLTRSSLCHQRVLQESGALGTGMNNQSSESKQMKTQNVEACQLKRTEAILDDFKYIAAMLDSSQAILENQRRIFEKRLSELKHKLFPEIAADEERKRLEEKKTREKNLHRTPEKEFLPMISMDLKQAIALRSRQTVKKNEGVLEGVGEGESSEEEDGEGEAKEPKSTPTLGGSSKKAIERDDGDDGFELSMELLTELQSVLRHHRRDEVNEEKKGNQSTYIAVGMGDDDTEIAEVDGNGDLCSL